MTGCQFAPVVGAVGDVSEPRQRISTGHFLFMTGVHIGAVASLAFFSWKNLALMMALYVATGLGITVGYHRLLSHRSFKTERWLTRTLATVGSIAMQGGPLRWAADHRTHHFHSDGERDPHDIKRGLFFAHMGWLFFLFPDAYDQQRIHHHTKDLSSDRYLRWLDRYHYLPGLMLGGLLLLTGGVGLFLWGFCTRLVVLYHSTWLVNSAAHRWGNRRFGYAVGHNNWVVALLAFGEGWHNNHHAWPSSAQQGLAAWEIDASWGLIRLFDKLGLAWDVARVELDPSRGRGGFLIRS